MKHLGSALIGLTAFLVSCAACGGPAGVDAPAARESAASGTTFDWPQWRGPDGDNVAHDPGFDPRVLAEIDRPLEEGGPRLVWKNKVGWGYSGVAVAGDFVFTLGFDRQSGRKGTDTVYCLRERTGEVVWKHSSPGTASTFTGPRAFPLVHSGAVYTLSWDGRLLCLNALSGSLVWTVNLKEKYGLEPRGEEFGYCSPPVIRGDILLVNARQWGVALNRRTGAELWASPKAKSGYAPPVPFTRNGTDLAAVFGAEKLYIVETLTGRVKASAEWPTMYEGNFADPVILGDTVLVSSSYEQGYGLFRLDRPGLPRVYRRAGLGAQMAAGVVIDGCYYGHDYWYFYGRGEYVCLEAATGKTMWTRKLGMGSVIAVDKTLLLLTETGRLSAVEARPDAFREIAACQLDKPRKGYWFTLPTYARSRLYLRNYRGDVLCLDLAKK